MSLLTILSVLVSVDHRPEKRGKNI